MSIDHFVSFEQARLLVVDDDPILREFACVHLSTPKVEVEVAQDGEAAWRRLAKGGIDIALIDLDMPRMDGFELIGLIRADEDLKHLPVVIITGREDMVAVDKAHAVGATSFVVKPLNWRLLSHQLSYVLRNHRDEATLRGVLKNLQQSNILKSEILKLSHQKLDKPLEAITSMIEHIGRISDNDEIGSAIAEITKAVDSIRRLNEDMSMASKLIEQP